MGSKLSTLVFMMVLVAVLLVEFVATDTAGDIEVDYDDFDVDYDDFEDDEGGWVSVLYEISA